MIGGEHAGELRSSLLPRSAGGGAEHCIYDAPQGNGRCNTAVREAGCLRPNRMAGHSRTDPRASVEELSRAVC